MRKLSSSASDPVLEATRLVGGRISSLGVPEVARRIGVSESLVVKWVYGAKPLTLRRLLELAAVPELGIEVSISLVHRAPPATAPAREGEGEKNVA